MAIVGGGGPVNLVLLGRTQGVIARLALKSCAVLAVVAGVLVMLMPVLPSAWMPSWFDSAVWWVIVIGVLVVFFYLIWSVIQFLIEWR